MTIIEAIKDLIEDPTGIAIREDIVFKNKTIQITDSQNPKNFAHYTNINGKLSTLKKQYLDVTSFNMAKEAIERKENNLRVSLIGEPKHGSNAKNEHCLKFMTIDIEKKEVNIYVRSSDLIKKFQMDARLVEEIISDLGLDNTKFTYTYNFDLIRLRAPFFWLYLKELTQNQIDELLSQDVPIVKIFKKYCEQALQKDIKYKSLERTKRYMIKHPSWAMIKKHIVGGDLQ